MSLTADDMKMIGEEFERALKPVYQWQENADRQFSAINRRFDELDSKLEEMQSTLDAHSASLIKIENTLGAYADAYKANRDQIHRLDTRVSAIADHLGLPTPSDHQ